MVKGHCFLYSETAQRKKKSAKKTRKKEITPRRTNAMVPGTPADKYEKRYLEMQGSQPDEGGKNKKLKSGFGWGGFFNRNGKKGIGELDSSSKDSGKCVNPRKRKGRV